MPEERNAIVEGNGAAYEGTVEWGGVCMCWQMMTSDRIGHDKSDRNCLANTAYGGA